MKKRINMQENEDTEDGVVVFHSVLMTGVGVRGMRDENNNKTTEENKWRVRWEGNKRDINPVGCWNHPRVSYRTEIHDTLTQQHRRLMFLAYVAIFKH